MMAVVHALLTFAGSGGYRAVGLEEGLPEEFRRRLRPEVLARLVDGLQKGPDICFRELLAEVPGGGGIPRPT